MATNANHFTVISDKIHVPARKFIDILLHLFVSHSVQRWWWRGRSRVRGATHSQYSKLAAKSREEKLLMLHFNGRRRKLDFLAFLLCLVLFSLVALLLWQRKEFFWLFRRPLPFTRVRSSGGTFKNCFWVWIFSYRLLLNAFRSICFIWIFLWVRVGISVRNAIQLALRRA